MSEMVRLTTRPSRDGKTFTFVLVYKDENGKRVFRSLGHADKRKAQRQQAQKERELRMGIVQPGSLKLSDFLEDSIQRIRGQVRQGTICQAKAAMTCLIKAIGNIDYKMVQQTHGERFLQYCLDHGNSPATAGKKLRHLKRMFQLAVQRAYLDQNPLRYIRLPRSPKKSIRVLTDAECSQLLTTATAIPAENGVDFPLLLEMALCTGMRRGELLNLTWPEIDFENRIVEVSPKDDTEYTWKWEIKDHDRRKLPLTERLVNMLAKRQSEASSGNPYVFIPTARYEFIQAAREAGTWDYDSSKCPMNNFDRQFNTLLKKAGLENVRFHDLRRTCLTNWFVHGLREMEVMTMAGHSSFETTRKFYLAVSTDLVNRTRQISDQIAASIFVTHLSRAPQNA